MCLIIYKKNASIKIPVSIIEQTALENRDGFGVTYLDTLQTYRTMDYKRAAEMLQVERPLIAHYRYATRGSVGKNMCHPFRFDKGWLYSNGTVDGLGSSTVCDTQVVADLLNNSPKKYWKHILSMTPTRFAIVEKRGTVSLHGNWIEKDGILYSKDISVRKVTYYNGYTGGNKYFNSPTKGTSTTGWQDKAPTRGIDEDYWEHEVVAKRVVENEEGAKQLDEWLRQAEARRTGSPVEAEITEVEVIKPPIGFHDREDNKSPYKADSAEVGAFATFCKELASWGLEYPQSFGSLVECPDGAVYDAETGALMPKHFVDGLPSDIYDFVMGAYDPYDVESSYGGELEEHDWEGNHTVIVYGTLKHGKGNHGWAHPVDDNDPETEFLGRGRTVESLRMTISGIPFVYPGDSPRGHFIHVEVYAVPSVEARNNIDSLEGHPHNYTRRLTDVTMEDGSIVTGWMYYIESSECPVGAKYWAKF